jgi:hypothetical protein
MIVRSACGLAVIVLWSALAGCSTESADLANDQRVVFCLGSSDRREDLVDAAIRLGLAKPSRIQGHVSVGGRDTVVEQWRGPGFDRACDALMEASRNQAPPSATPEWLTNVLATGQALLLLLAGALVTLLTGGLKDAGTRRRVLAGELRAVTDDFVDICGAYLDAQLDHRHSAPTDQLVRDRRQALVAKLREVRALYQGSVDTEPSLTLLTDPLGEAMLRNWELDDPPEKQQRVEALRTHLTSLSEQVAVITNWLERSFLARLGSVK